MNNSTSEPPPVQSGATQQPSSTSGIDGRTVAGNCPVVSEPPCGGQPVSARLSIVDAISGSLVTTVTSGRDGWFSVAVRPGRYLVRLDELVGGPARTNGSSVVTVASGSYTTITFHIDRGIR